MGIFAELLDIDEPKKNRNLFSSYNIYKFEAVSTIFCFPTLVVGKRHSSEDEDFPFPPYILRPGPGAKSLQGARG